ncbi:MAG: hypothetical protein QOH86_1240, partial [Sphingomonadales bacterium]|nr:hypothetical protein [Sphingomonadales bacterium]
AAGDAIQIIFDKTSVYLLLNNARVGGGTNAIAVAAGSTFYIKASLYQQGAVLPPISFDQVVTPWSSLTGDDVAEAKAEAAGSIDGLSDIAIKFNSDGTAKTGELPRNEGYKFFKSGAVVTSGLTWTYTVLSGTINTFTNASGAQAISGAGAVNFTVSSIGTDEAIVQLQCAGGSPTPRTKTVRVYRDKSAPPTNGSAGGGTFGSDSNLASFGGTGMTTVGSADLVVTVGNAGSVALAASVDVDSNATSSTVSETYGIFQWWNGSTFVDVGSETPSDPDCQRAFDSLLGGGTWYTVTTGSVVISTSKTGLTVGSSQKFRFQMRRAIGAASATYYPTGTVSAQG